jgi:hypothetical protein
LKKRIRARMETGEENDPNSPREKANLVSLALAFLVKLKVVYSPSRLGFREVSDEFVIVIRCGHFINDDLGVVFVELVQDVLVFLALFQGLIFFETVVVNLDTGSLLKANT